MYLKGTIKQTHISRKQLELQGCTNVGVQGVPQTLHSADVLSFGILALDSQSGEVNSCGPLKESDVYWNLCGLAAAADQALLRLDLPTEPQLKMLLLSQLF